MVPILAIAVQRDTAKTLPQEQPRIPRPLAGASASLSGAAPFRSGTHLPEPTVPIRTIAAQRNTAKLCHKAASHPPALWPVHRHPCRAARFPGAPGWTPFQTSSNFDGSHPGNRRSKGHRENSATGAASHSPPFGRCIGVPAGPCPLSKQKYVSELPLHSSNRHSKEHRENFATGATSHSPPFGRYIGVPVGRCPLSKRHAPPRACRP